MFLVLWAQEHCVWVWITSKQKPVRKREGGACNRMPFCPICIWAWKVLGRWPLTIQLNTKWIGVKLWPPRSRAPSNLRPGSSNKSPIWSAKARKPAKWLWSFGGLRPSSPRVSWKPAWRPPWCGGVFQPRWVYNSGSSKSVFQNHQRYGIVVIWHLSAFFYKFHLMDNCQWKPLSSNINKKG